MRAPFSCFEKDDVIGVAFTGMAADNQRKLAKTGVTAHKIVHEWRRTRCGKLEFMYSRKKVLVLEESSSISIRVLHATHVALALPPQDLHVWRRQTDVVSRRRVSFLRARMIQYKNQPPVISQLFTSMRATDPTGEFVRDLDRICEHRVNDGFEWTSDPASKEHPFAFLRQTRDSRLPRRQRLGPSSRAEPSPPRAVSEMGFDPPPATTHGKRIGEEHFLGCDTGVYHRTKGTHSFLSLR